MIHEEYKALHPKSVIHVVTTRVPVVHEGMTIADVEALLLKDSRAFETINYIYITDLAKHLIGVMSIKDVFVSNKSKKIKEFVGKKIISVRPHTTQERAALIALRHTLKSVPIVDHENHFLGVVAPHDLLRIVDKEGVENVLRVSGVVYSKDLDNVSELSTFTSLKHRLPWLLLGLVGGMLAAGIVGGFEETLSKNIILATFIPLIVYMADAVGTQMEAFIIRDLAVDPKMNFIHYLLKQFFVVTLIGGLVSFLLYLGSIVIYQRPDLSLVLGLSLFFAILSALFTGLIIPYLFSKIKMDPANASGPIATIVQDLLSILVYFIIAAWLL